MAQCLNNLKQLGLAAQNYHDSYNAFPAGWYCSAQQFDMNGNLIGGDPNCILQGPAAPAGNATIGYMWGGIPGLLLKMEQANLWNQINFNWPDTDYSNTSAIRTRIDGLICPSNSRLVSNQTGTATPPPPIGHSDYRGNMAAGMATNANCSAVSVANPSCFLYDNGIMFQNSAVGLADVTDGSSNTVLMGETLRGTWPDGTSCCVRTNIDRNLNKPIVLNGVNYYTYWMSKHPGMVNFVKCDGSVTSIKDTVNNMSLIKVMTRNGGESISSGEL